MIVTVILDMEQQVAVKSNSENILVVAAPGSGKTTVIVNRLNYLVQELGEDEERVSVITFTRAAALNMKTRYKALKGSESTAFFGTFHALYYKILREFYTNNHIIDDSISVNIIRKVLNTYSSTIHKESILKILNDIRRFKTERNNQEHFKASVDFSIFMECYEAYEIYKNVNFLWDYEDLQVECLQLLSTNQGIRSKYQEKFRHILIDEFQDCDENQVKILKILNYRNSIFAVGDEDQSIYSFRGAAPKYMVSFDTIFPNSQKLFLNTNYRCPEKIVEKSTNLINNNLMRNNKLIKAYNSMQCSIETLNFVDDLEQANTVVNKILEYIELNNESLQDNIILYRTRTECKRLVDALLEKNVKFSFVDEPFNFYDHYICRDIITVLKLSCDFTNREAFIGALQVMDFHMSHLLKNKLLKNKFKSNCFDIIKELVSTPEKLRDIHRLEKQFIKIKNMRYGKIIDFIFVDMGYEKYLKKSLHKEKVNEKSIRWIINNLKQSMNKFLSTDDFIAHAELNLNAVKQSTLNNEGVFLSTLHGVKGMEFKNVYIVNCNEGIIPHSRNLENIEEERRLFYVGITRCKNSLTLCCTEKLHEEKMQPSRFIGEMKL